MKAPWANDMFPERLIVLRLVAPTRRLSHHDKRVQPRSGIKKYIRCRHKEYDEDDIGQRCQKGGLKEVFIILLLSHISCPKKPLGLMSRRTTIIAMAAALAAFLDQHRKNESRKPITSPVIMIPFMLPAPASMTSMSIRRFMVSPMVDDSP